jgi:hypothetical protein
MAWSERFISKLPMQLVLTFKANVMLAYPIEEAETLLQSKLKTAQDSLQSCEEDLDFLREQITVRAHSCFDHSLTAADNGSSHGTGVQLGRGSAKERQDKRGVHRRRKGTRAQWMSQADNLSGVKVLA